MKKRICIVLCAVMLFSLCACGAKPEPPVQETPAEWTREGFFSDDNGNMLSVTWMEDVADPGWYVGCMLGEDPIEDSWGGMLQQEGNSLLGALPSSGSKDDLTVTLSEEGEDGLLLAVEGGETYHFVLMDMPEATIIVTVNTEGWGGMIGYAEGEEAPEIDPEWPYQSAQINLAEPAAYTLAAAPEAGSRFVKWTKNGEDFSTEPVITVLLDESADFIAVFEEDSDWQNPVMNFVGNYQCDRARATVECSGADEAWITIEWAGSAWELARWDIVEPLDPDTLTIHYSGVTKSIITYDSNGEIVSQEPEYEDGTGTITFNYEENSFTWHEDQSPYGTDMVFEWVPVTIGGPEAVGGWTLTEDGALTEEAQSAFDKAMEGLVGVNYTPLALLGTQIVSGTNYCFLCEATVVYPGAQPYYSVVTVYQDLQGAAEVRNIAALDLGRIAESGEITDVQPDGSQLLGGWTVDRESSVDAEGAVMHLASQLVSGTNHCVLCKGWTLAFIYEDLQGNTELKTEVPLDISALSQPAE